MGQALGAGYKFFKVETLHREDRKLKGIFQKRKYIL